VKGRGLRRGDVVEVKSPNEIHATLDSTGALEALPFMPEMIAYCGRRFVVAGRAEKVCDTVHHWGSRRFSDTVFLEELRCDGTGHGGCQAECRLYWKESWLRRVTHAGAADVKSEVDSNGLLHQLTVTQAVRTGSADAPDRYRCQATEAFRASAPLRLLGPAPYFREYRCGNVRFLHWLRVICRATVVETRRKLGLLPAVHVPGPGSSSPRGEPLSLQPGDWVRVKTREAIAETLTKQGTNRGLSFDREMLPFCGTAHQVRQRINRIVDEQSGEMIAIRSDCLSLEGAVCSGDRSDRRWFCARQIYPYWREAWLEREHAPRPDRIDVVTSGETSPVVRPDEHGDE
jgi:hypothetical protein